MDGVYEDHISTSKLYASDLTRRDQRLECVYLVMIDLVATSVALGSRLISLALPLSGITSICLPYHGL